jgi:two-component system, NarL family, sensor histidine kinase BarA
MELKNIPVIDWELGTKLAGNKKELAEEMLSLLIETLTDESSMIQQLFIDKNFTELLRRVHRLHGALCYCGLPRLKTVVTRLETELKNNIMVNLPFLLNQLDIEINLLLEHHAHVS